MTSKCQQTCRIFTFYWWHRYICCRKDRRWSLQNANLVFGALYEYTTHNFLNINLGKSVYMHFRPGRNSSCVRSRECGSDETLALTRALSCTSAERLSYNSRSAGLRKRHIALVRANETINLSDHTWTRDDKVKLLGVKIDNELVGLVHSFSFLKQHSHWLPISGNDTGNMKG